MFKNKDDGTNPYSRQTDFTKPFVPKEKMPIQTQKTILTCGIMMVTILLMGFMVTQIITTVDATDFVICQRINGKIQVMDNPGIHLNMFGKTWTYRRYDTFRMEDNLTFIDGRTRKVETFVRFRLPESDSSRVALHKIFNGQMHNVEEMVDAATTNAIKLAACTMTATYYHADGKGRMEITKMVKDQLENGLYTTIRQIDDKGVFTTKIATDKDGNYLYSTEPILSKYGLTLEAFGIVSTQIPPDDEMTEALGMESETSWNPPELSLASSLPLIK